MLAKTELSKIYETVLCIPGMNDNVKIALSIPRKNVLLLSKVIEKGLSVKDSADKSISILEIVPKTSLQELQTLVVELLEKAGLTEMNKNLQSF
ncbi:MAG TPA: hypothetical protein PLM81_10420 [Ginsengibacter sp.]|nr:hypothetical protein [Ginsengibacter sp.]HUN02289.1 hypothetical protein [Niabella sp.]